MTTIGTSYNVSPNTAADNIGIPIGTMLLWGTSTAPVNYILCNGAAVSRRTYAPLFAVLGTTWGVGDGTTTFNVPNTAGRVIRGVNGSYTLAGTGGADTVTLTDNNLPAHRHGQLQGGGVNVISSGGTTVQGNVDNVDNGTRTVGTFLQATNVAVANTAVAIVEPWVGVNYIIKFA
jgi:microcystin-dependent protein